MPKTILPVDHGKPVTVRFTRKEIAVIDRKAKRIRLTRSQFVRRAVMGLVEFIK